jgi:hypothetical protein
MVVQFPIIGRFEPGQVRVDWTDSRRRIDPDIEALIEQQWSAALRRPGIHLFDGAMGRLESADVRDGTLHLTLSRTSYRVFVGTNMSCGCLPADADRATFANPLGLSTLLISADGHLLMGRRNERVAYYPLHVHPFAGCLEPAEAVDVFDEIRRELREELSIEPAGIEQIVCLGMAEDPKLRQPELIFATRCRRALPEIAAALHPEEHRGIFTRPATQTGLESAIAADEAFTPVGLAALLLWGHHQFGQPWFQQQLRRLNA